MSKLTADDYILRISAGTSYNPESLIVVNPNDEMKPILIDSEHFIGYVVVRVLNFQGVNPSTEKLIPNPASSYFQGRNRRYSIMVQGRWKKNWNGDDIVFAVDLDSKVRVPTGAGLGIKIAKWLDPALDADLYANQPYVYSPWVTAMNSLSVYKLDNPIIRDSTTHIDSSQINSVTSSMKTVSLDKQKKIRKLYV